MFITVYSLLQSEFSSEASDMKLTARSLSIRCELAASAPPFPIGPLCTRLHC